MHHYNRMIRGEVMESERVLALPYEARWFFWSILMTADDLGLFEATDFKMARNATMTPAQAGLCLQMLADTDLVRLYIVDGKRYGFLPRFRQRLQIKRSKFDLPPAALVADEPAILRKINDLASDPPLETRGQPSEAEEEAEEGIGVSSSSKTQHLVGAGGASRIAEPVPDCPHQRLLAMFIEAVPSLPAPMSELWAGTKAKNLRARWRWVLTAKRSGGKKAGQRYATTEAEGLEFFGRMFAYVESSDFLSGRDGRWHGCSLDWIVKESNFAKVLQGNYENKAATT
jgi:hypothetical protein